MEQLRTHVIALLLMVTFVLGVTVFERSDAIATFLSQKEATAAVINPVSEFLGISKTQNSQESTARVIAQPTQEEKTTLWDRVRSIVNTPTPRATLDSRSISNVSLSERTPLLLCIPSVARKNETLIVLWACRDGANRTQAQGFTTEGEVAGVTRVRADAGKTLSLDCITDRDDDTFTTTVASCALQVVEPTISLIASPETIAPGELARITWQTNGIRSCALRSSTDPSFVRSGITGDVVYRPRVNSKLTLTCEDATGLSIQKSIQINVQ